MCLGFEEVMKVYNIDAKLEALGYKRVNSISFMVIGKYQCVSFDYVIDKYQLMDDKITLEDLVKRRELEESWSSLK